MKKKPIHSNNINVLGKRFRFVTHFTLTWERLYTMKFKFRKKILSN